MKIAATIIGAGIYVLFNNLPHANSAESGGATAATTQSAKAVVSLKPIRVMIYEDAGSPAKGGENIYACLDRSPSFVMSRVKAKDIQAGVLDQADVLFMPGGTGSGEAKALGEDGREKIRAFVKNGGGYVGICAGSYLASSFYPWSLHILNSAVVDREHWARGKGPIQLKLNASGKETLASSVDEMTCMYAQGPLMAPGNEPGLGAYEQLGTFGSEVHKDGVPGGVMVGTTAIARGTFGKGHVIACSPHPEATEGLDGFVRRMAEWAATGDVGHISPPTKEIVRASPPEAKAGANVGAIPADVGADAH